MNQAINILIEWIVILAVDLLTPMMVVALIAGLCTRGVVYYTISRELWFAEQLEKRTDFYFENTELPPNPSFYATLKVLLEKNYYELFVVRSIMRRRKPDSVATLSDRLFLIQNGCARLVKASLRSVRFLRYNGQQPKFLNISKNVFESNPCFNRLLGVVPTSLVNDLLNILPGLFIVGGIFGTFLGIMKGLPGLGAMDLSDVDGSKKIMDAFLINVAYAMGSSVLGIVCSVAMTLFNTTFSPDKMFLTAVNRFDAVLNSVWVRCVNNEIPNGIKDFDEHKDSIEFLAQQAVDNEAIRKVPLISNAS